jgi:hypothetical protein
MVFQSFYRWDLCGTLDFELEGAPQDYLLPHFFDARMPRMGVVYNLHRQSR